MSARLARSTAAAALGAALVLAGLTGCTFMTPQATTEHYEPSDGINATVGELEVRNALLLSADGTSASLLVSIQNPTKYGVQVNVQYEDADNAKVDDTIYINAGSVGSFGGADSARILLSGVDAKPGTLFPVYFQYEDVSGKQLWVPVLDGSLSEYADLVPDAAP